MYCTSSSDDSIDLLSRRRPTRGLHTLLLQKLGENGQQKYRAMFFYCIKGHKQKIQAILARIENRHNTRHTCETVVFSAFHYLFIPPWLLVIGVSRTSLMVGGFQSKALLALLEEGTVPSAVCCGSDWLLFCLIVGIHASGISIPLSLLIGSSLVWIASLTLREYQWGSQSINLTATNDKRNPLYTLSKMNNIFHDNCLFSFLIF